jgi:hypothetical protein
MNIFSLSESKRTPEIIFNLETGELIFNGNSTPEDVNLFYSPLLTWIDINKPLIVNDIKTISIQVNLVYFNSATLKFLVSLLKYIISLKGVDNVKITWCYDRDDEDMLETAKDISKVLSIPIKFVVKE